MTGKNDFSEYGPGFFITGTDTGIGKTTVASALISHLAQAGLTVAGMKPVASGCQQIQGQWQNDDALTLMAASGVATTYTVVNPFAYGPAIAPHLAAQHDNRPVEISVIKKNFNHLRSVADLVIVEGAGGWLTPINENHSMSDIVLALELPVILVVGMRLGCLNHALLTARAILEQGSILSGWVANGIDPDFDENSANIATLNNMIPAPCLGVLPWSDQEVSSVKMSKRLDLGPLSKLT